MAHNSLVRKARYKYLRNLGYSRLEATRLRDQSRENIKKNLHITRRKLSRIARKDRSVEQTRRLRDIRRTIERERTPGKTGDIILTDNARLNDWKRWSSPLGNGFPRNMQERAEKYNTNSGRDPNDSYGYRALYHSYVNHRPEVEATVRAEKAGSERK